MNSDQRNIHMGLLLCLAIFLPGCATNSITGRSQLMLVSEQSAIAQSSGAYSSLISGLKESGKLSKDTKLVAQVREITDRLITQAVKYRPETKSWQWSAEVIDDPETVNAFCMAGGKMAIFTGLINKVEPSDDEIAQVMGHEISHALANHTAEKMSVKLAAGLAVVAITSTANNRDRRATHDISSLAALTLITLPNSREAESEADRIGIELAAKAGYSPHAAVTLWEKMMAVSGSTSRFDFLSTHPASPKRIEALAALEEKASEYYAIGKANRILPAEIWTRETSTLAQNQIQSARDHSLVSQTLQPSKQDLLPKGSLKKTKNTGPFKYSVSSRLRELQSLKKDGLITEVDFQRKKKALLAVY